MSHEVVRVGRVGAAADRPLLNVRDHAHWRGAWVWLSLAAAGTISVVEIVLMEARFGVLRGGFLIDLHLATTSSRAAFMILSVLSDLTLVAPMVVMTLWASRLTRIARAPRYFLAFVAGVLPLAFYDFFAYELLKYLGDAFDLSLMFDLVGRSPHELLPIAGAHLLMPALLVTGICAVTIVTAWRLQVRFPDQGRHLAGGARLWGCVLVLGLAGTAIVTMTRFSSDTMQSVLRRKPSAQALAVVVNVLTDWDRDGVGLSYIPADPAPFNAAVKPYAVEIPGNGIDDNGIGGDLTAGIPASIPPAPPAWGWRPDVVLVFLESVRADAVGASLDGHPVTPVIDAIARAGNAAQAAFSHNGYTYQSRFHLFTGSLSSPVESSLIDDFKANRYQVGYFSGQDDSFGGPSLSVGFERADVFVDARADVKRRYTQFQTPGSLAVPAGVVLERAMAFLHKSAPDAPLFLYVNFHDTHFPYHHRNIDPIVSTTVLDQGDIRPERASELRRMYLNTVANVDQAIGALLAEVTRVRQRAPAVIVTSDHGESLFDEGFLGHGYALNDAQTRVPFVAAGLPLKISEPFGHADVRSALSAALATEPQDDARPTFVPARGRRTLQYLGSIDRPRQIGFVSDTGRVLYDFRTDRMRTPAADWHRAAGVGDAERALLFDLVHRWETSLLPAADRQQSESWQP